MCKDRCYARLEFDSDKLLTIRNARIDPYDYFSSERHVSYMTQVPHHSYSYNSYLEESRTKGYLSDRHRKFDESEESFTCGNRPSFYSPWKYITRVDIVIGGDIHQVNWHWVEEALRCDTMHVWEPMMHIYQTTADMESGKNELPIPDIKRKYVSPESHVKQKLPKRRKKLQHKLSPEEKSLFKKMLYSKIAMAEANKQASNDLHRYFYDKAFGTKIELRDESMESRAKLTYIESMIQKLRDHFDEIRIPTSFITYKFGDPMYSNPEFKDAYNGIVSNMIDFHVAGNEMGWIEAEKYYPTILNIVGKSEADTIWQNCDMIGQNAAKKRKV